MMHHLGQFIRGLLILLVPLVLLGWFIVRTVRRAEDPVQIIVKWVITLPLALLCVNSVRLFGPAGPFFIVFCAIILSILWTPHLGGMFAGSITSMFDGGNVPPDRRPFYSIAQSRQKQGRYLEAITEIRKQLHTFPNDFEGHMLLAEVQAEDLKDLSAAELTVNRLCAQPGHAPKNIAYALYSMADWHLRFAQDREAARQNLEKVIELLPDSEFSMVASQRIAHLGNPDLLLSPHDRKRFAVQEGVRNIGLLQKQNVVKPVEKDPAEQAQEYVKHLEQHPLDTEAREKLAVIYADHYTRLDLAMDELEQLIALPHQAPKNIVHWLNLLADIQIRGGIGFEEVKQTLERIIEVDPDLAAAEMARKRINLLRLELKSKQQNQSVKLGVYEQNIGLKNRTIT
jgi:tetratricopeptide (TPR) repeat protein